MAERVAIVGFDGTEQAIVQRGIDEGWMPSMAALAREGRFVRLGGQQDILTSTSGPTLVRACPVQDHLLLNATEIVPGSYTVRDVDETGGRRPPFWVHLDRAGLACTLVSVYSAPLIPGLRGTQVLGWGSNDPFTTKDRRAPRSEPAEALRLLEREVGRREMRHGRQHPRTPRERRRFFDGLAAGARRQMAGLEIMLRRTSWDLFFGSVVEAHVAGHLGWPRSWAGRPGLEEDVPAPIRAAYHAVDEGVGRLREACPPGTAFLVASVYGMVPNNAAADFMEPILEAGGWLVRPAAQHLGGGPASALRVRLLRAGRRSVRRVAPPSVRPLLGRLVPRSRWLNELAVSEVDWTRTRAFLLPSDTASYLRVNLAGREPHGIVRPGAEYDALCDELVEVAHGLVDADTERPAVSQAVRLDREFGRPVEGPLPDVCVAWAADVPARRLRSARLGAFAAPGRDPRAGVHRAPGYLLGAVPGVAGSGGARLEGGAGDLIDVGPTVLALLGVDPSPLPGRPIAELTGRG